MSGPLRIAAVCALGVAAPWLWHVATGHAVPDAPRFWWMLGCGSAAALLGAYGLLRAARGPDTDLLTGSTARRERGLPYCVTTDAHAHDRGSELRIRNGALHLTPIENGAAPEIAVDAISVVAPRSGRVVVGYHDVDGTSRALSIGPAGGDDFGRLLWELREVAPWAFPHP